MEGRLESVLGELNIQDYARYLGLEHLFVLVSCYKKGRDILKKNWWSGFYILYNIEENWTLNSFKIWQTWIGMYQIVDMAEERFLS